MQFSRADADLCSEPIFKAIGKTRRAVHHDAAGIHFTQEALRRLQIVRDDGVRMFGRVFFNESDGFIQAFHNRNRNDRRVVFRIPVRRLRINAGQSGRFQHGLGLGVTTHLHVFLGKDFSNAGKERFCNGFVHQKRFRGVARGITLRLGVVGDGNCHVNVSVLVDVGVADAVKMVNHRHGSFCRKTCNQSFAAARNDYVNVFVGPNHFAHKIAISSGSDLHGFSR